MRAMGVVACAMVMGMAGLALAAGERPAAEPRRAAERVASEAVRPGWWPAESSRRTTPGVWVVVTWGLEDDELTALLRDARRVGYPVVARGVWRESMPETRKRVGRLVGEQGERAPILSIDPPLVRTLGVEMAPALVVRGTERVCVVAGRRPLGDLIARLAREWPAFQPWADRAARALARRDEAPGTVEGLTWPGEPPACRVRLEPPPVPLAERDLAEAIREAVLAHDWAAEQARARERALARLREGPGFSLPRAERAERRLVDPTVEVRERVVDPVSRRVLAEPGQRINPLPGLTWSGAWLVVDGTDAAQVAWVDRRLGLEPVAGILLARGDAFELRKRWARIVQWLPSELVDRLALSALPAVIRGRGEQVEVEVDVVGNESDGRIAASR